jgi:hypothetical protein
MKSGAFASRISLAHVWTDVIEHVARECRRPEAASAQTDGARWPFAPIRRDGRFEDGSQQLILRARPMRGMRCCA